MNNIIGLNLPYTLGLSLTSTLIAWIIGNIVGLIAGFRPKPAPPRSWRASPFVFTLCPTS